MRRKKCRGEGKKPRKATTAYGFFIKEFSKNYVETKGGTVAGAIKFLSKKWNALND